MGKKSTMKQVARKIAQNEKESEDVLMSRCVPVARAIIKLIAEADLDPSAMGPRQLDAQGKPLPPNPNDRPPEYIELALKVMQVFLDSDLVWMEKDLVLQLVTSPFLRIQDMVTQDFEKGFNRAIGRMFEQEYGVRLMGDMKFSQVDEFVKKYPPRVTSPEVSVSDVDKSNEETSPEVDLTAPVPEVPETPPVEEVPPADQAAPEAPTV